MALLRRLIERRTFETGGTPSTLLPTDVARSVSGRRVTDDEALRTSAVYACVRILSESIAALPATVVRKDGDRREHVDTHPVAQLIGQAPNPEQDAAEFWRMVLVYALTGGNGYGWIERDGNGMPRAMWPIPAGRVRVDRSPRSREIVYDVRLSEEEAGPGQERSFKVGMTDMLHIRAFGTHRLLGISPIAAARESIGTARSAQDYASRFYERDASPGGVLQVPDELTDEQFERLEQGWRRTHEGLQRSHAVAILEGGAQWHAMGISPQDAEFIATRKFETSEIARIFGVPPHFVGDVERSTSFGTVIEQQNIGFLQFSLVPWMDRLERVATKLLLRQPPYGDDGLYVRWNPAALLRGDQQARFTAYATGKQWGWLSTNDIRALEDLSPVEGGDRYLEPENMRSVKPDPDDAREQARRVNVAKELWSAGFDPAEAAQWARVDVEHLGLLPTSVQSQQPLPGLEDFAPRELRVANAIRTTARRRAVSAMIGFFAGQRQGLAEAIGSDRPPRLGELFDRNRWDSELAQVLFAAGVAAATDYGGAIMPGYDPFDHMSGWLGRVSRIAAEEINASTVERIDRALADGVDLDEALAIVEDDSRAEELAGSHASTCGNRAQHDAAQRSGRRTKTWLTTSSDPRGTHAALNGETVSLGESFSNGAQYPSDETLPVEERINCRCDLQFQ